MVSHLDWQACQRLLGDGTFLDWGWDMHLVECNVHTCRNPQQVICQVQGGVEEETHGPV